MNSILLKIRLGCGLIGLLLYMAPYALASSATLTFSSTNVSLREQLYVDVFVDPENTSINGIDGRILFSKDMLSFVRAEEGQSVVTLWIEPAKAFGDTILFTGIIPNGFLGVIDPFNTTLKKPGKIIRLVFEAIKSGTARVQIESLIVTKNDGIGTEIHVPSIGDTVVISQNSNAILYKNPTSLNPELHAQVIREPMLFDGKYVFIFNARDSESGIENVSVKEGSREWKKVTSPYLLEDQTRHSTLYIQATNFSGKSTLVMIDQLPCTLFSPQYGILFLVCIILLFILRRKYVHTR